MFLTYQGTPLMGLTVVMNPDNPVATRPCKNILIPSILISSYPTPTHITVNPETENDVPVLAPVDTGNNNVGTAPVPPPAPATPTTPTPPTADADDAIQEEAVRTNVEATFSRVANGDSSVVASKEFQNIEQASSQGQQSSTEISGAKSCQ